MRRTVRRLRAATVIAAALSVWAPGARAAEVLVFAAASLKTALDEVAAEWTAQTGVEAGVSYAASSALARQIEEGAPAEVFLSADLDWMDHLEERELIVAESRRDLLGNRLALIAEGREAAPVEIAPGFDLAGMLGEGRLAVAEVASVPAGRYAKAALESLGVWEAVEPKLAQAENVRAALAFVAQGEAPYGIVYATDAGAEDNVTVVGTFPEESHPRIVYPGALVAGAGPEAAAFLDHLSGPEARAAFEAQGFEALDGADADARSG